MNEQKLDLLLDEMREQNDALRKQLFWTRLCVLLLVVFFVAAGTAAAIVGPQLTVTLDRTNQITQELSTVANELADLDFDSMFADVNILVEDSQKTMQEALTKIQAIDIETLNEAIDGLNTVVRPLANLFDR